MKRFLQTLTLAAALLLPFSVSAQPTRQVQSHAAQHQNAGSDEVATATPGANAIPKAEADGDLNAGWVGLDQAYAWTGAVTQEDFSLVDPGAKPTCDASENGRVFFDTTTLEVCLDEGGGYAWTTMLGVNLDDLAMTGNPTITDATNPSLVITDTTNPTSLQLSVSDTSALMGTTTDHPVFIIGNGVPWMEFQTDQDIVWGSGAEASMVMTLNVSGTDSTITAQNNQIDFSTGILTHGGSTILVENGSYELGPTTFGTASSESSQYSTANTDGYFIRETTNTTSASSLEFTKLRGSSAANDGDSIGDIIFLAKDDNDSPFATSEFAQISATVVDASGGSRDGALHFYTTVGETEDVEMFAIDDAPQFFDPGTTKPTCAVGERFSVWPEAGGAGVADTFEICVKNVSDVYEWTDTLGGGGSAITNERFSFLENTVPWPGDGVYKDTLDEVTTNGFWMYQTNIFEDVPTRECLFGQFNVPSQFGSNASIVFVWATGQTSGNARWSFGYNTVGGNDTESIDDGGEILDENEMDTHVEWDVTGDFTDSSGHGAYSHSTGTGTLTQVAADQLGTSVGSTIYHFIYTVKAHTGDVACNITTAFAASTTSIPTELGKNIIYFTSAASPGDFVVSCTSTSGTFTIDGMYLQANAIEVAEVTDAAGSAAWERMEAEISITGGNFAANDTVQFEACRAGNDSADTLAGTAVLLGGYFEYDH